MYKLPYTDPTKIAISGHLAAQQKYANRLYVGPAK